MSHVLIVDDEPAVCWGFGELLAEDGHRVSTASSAEEALRLVEQNRPDALVLDVRLPGMDGLSALPRFRERLGDVPIVVMTAYGSLDVAVEAIREGAFDYLTKPFDLKQAGDVVRRALEAGGFRHGRASADAPQTGVGERMIGSSPAMQEIFKRIALVAASDVPVLIRGESGTGKELVARAIHHHSHRRSGPFVPINVASLNPGVVESELFGHVQGAFTGAERDRRGWLELAGKGTVFLDEIGEIPASLQVKLLRTLEQREVMPVGGVETRPVDVRIVAATNRDLDVEMAAGRFREDLYFRLSVFCIDVPPLRDRREDIPALAEYFAARTGAPAGQPFSEEVLSELQRRDWPGNVRELRNAIEHAVILARGGPIQVEHLPPPMTNRGRSRLPVGAHSLDEAVAEWYQREAAKPGDDLFERFLAAVEAPLLRTVLEACDSNRAEAARRLGIHRTTLRQKLRRYGLE